MKYFRTDGIRGEAYTVLTLEIAYLIGKYYKNSNKKIVIGMDTRKSSPDFAKAIINGLDNNKNVSFAGVIPTPGLMYYSLCNDTVAIMITASHNLYKDNGIKIIENGYKITKETIKEIEEFIDLNQDFKYENKDVDLVVDSSVIDFYKTKIKENIIKHDLKIIFDGANGAFSYILKELFDNDILINCEPNGTNINEQCGSTDLTLLIRALKEKVYDIGIAFDGDGDRIIVVDKNNKIYEGDFLTYIFAIDLLEDGNLTSNTVVFTEVTNPGIIEKLNSLGVYTVITEVGDHNIIKAMNREYILGGESSGHIINKNIVPFGDGLLNALQFIKVLTKRNKKLYEYSNELKLYYAKSYNVYFNNSNINLSNKVKTKIEKYANRRKKYIIVRKSGTENVIRIFIYQKSSKGINKTIYKIVKMIKNDQ